MVTYLKKPVDIRMVFINVNRELFKKVSYKSYFFILICAVADTEGVISGA